MTKTELRRLCDMVGMVDVSIVVSDVGPPGCGYADAESQTIVIGRQDSPQDYIGVTLHEIAHIIDRPLPSMPSPPVHLEHAELRLEKIPARRESVFARVMPPWVFHEAKFIRLCFHVRHRAMVAGFECSWTDLRCAGAQYGLSPPWMYGRILDDEPERLAHLPLRQIAEVPAPAEFLELFETDKAIWKKRDSA